MLAREFKDVMDPAERRASVSYYTPASLVREIVRAGLAAILVHRFGLAPMAAERWLHHGDPPDARPDLRRVAVLDRSEEHTSELQSQSNLVCRLLLEKKTDISPIRP